MVRAHTYPLLAAIASFSLLALALLQIPQAVKTHRYNRCIDEQVSLRSASNLAGQHGPGSLLYLWGGALCEGG